MSDPLQPLLFELLDEVQERAVLPDRLFHYTSQSGLLGLLKDRNVYATEVRYLNDQREYVHALELVTPIVEKRAETGSTDATTTAFWDSIRLGLSVVPTMRVFVSAFSENGDQLSQWRAYCGAGGYAVAFRADVLRSCALHMSDFCLLVKCSYDLKEQEEILVDILERLLAHYAAHHATWPSGDPNVAYGSAFATVLGMLAAGFKDPGFEEESEWRFVVRQWAADVSATPPEFRVGRRNIVPFLRVPWERERKSALAGLRVGPTPHMPAAVDAAEWLLKVHGIVGASVYGTTIPFRDW